jgi:DNA-binding NarL/FixJ family response regulator
LRGKSTKQIALDLGISPKTVDKHKVRMLHKMGVENPVELARLCFGRSERVPD